MYTPILFLWFNIKSNNVHTNFKQLNWGDTLRSYCAYATLSQAQNLMICTKVFMIG